MADPWRILLVDDNRSLVEALGDVCETCGYMVDTAYDGIQAVELARATRYDCILMDIRMPNMSGIDAFKRIKAILPTTPVILMTAYSVQGLIEEVVSEGIATIVDKPLVVGTLVQTLDYLKGKRGALLVDAVIDPELACAFREKGFNVVSAKTIGEALIMMTGRLFDVILVNAEIPGVTATGSVLLIRDCDLKCLIILMAAEPGLSNHLVYASLQKPFKMKQVLALLEKVRSLHR